MYYPEDTTLCTPYVLPGYTTLYTPYVLPGYTTLYIHYRTTLGIPPYTRCTSASTGATSARQRVYGEEALGSKKGFSLDMRRREASRTLMCDRS